MLRSILIYNIQYKHWRLKRDGWALNNVSNCVNLQAIAADSGSYVSMLKRPSITLAGVDRRKPLNVKIVVCGAHENETGALKRERERERERERDWEKGR